MPEETSSHLLLGAQNQQLAAEQQQLLWQLAIPLSGNLSRDGNSHGLGKSNAMTSLSETILQGALGGAQCYDWQRKCWMNIIKELSLIHI